MPVFLILNVLLMAGTKPLRVALGPIAEAELATIVGIGKVGGTVL